MADNEYISSYTGEQIDEGVGKGLQLPTVSAALAGAYLHVKNDGTLEYVDIDIEANPTIPAGATLSQLNTLKIKGLYYDAIPEKIKYETTAPSSANTSGVLKFVVLSSEPATKYAGYLYIITGSN